MVVALGMSATAEAKKVQVPKMYMFGMAASFNDTIVYFTNVQEIDSAWIEKKNKFLQARQLYSLQLRDYLASAKQMPHRTCIVYAHKNRKKVEKKYKLFLCAGIDSGFQGYAHGQGQSRNVRSADGNSY